MTIEELKSYIDYLYSRVDKNTPVDVLINYADDDTRQIEIASVTLVRTTEEEFYSINKATKINNFNKNNILINVAI